MAYNKILDCYFGKKITNIEKYADLDYKRPGQDVRYSLNDEKLRKIGWSAEKLFDKELPEIVDYYRKNFKW